MQFQQKKWVWSRRSRLYLGSREMQSSVSKFKGSIFAVILGLIIGAIVIAATGNNALTYFHYLLFFAFSSYGFNNWDNTLVWWAIYIIAGLALVISFKTGMFNIGVAGQMLAAGAVVIAIGIRYDLSQPLAIIVALICGVLAAVLVAVVTALLKVLFNVHEVVTSILLNWAIWYLVKWVYTTTKDLYDSSRAASLPVHDSMNFAVGGYKFIIPLILAFILVIVVWFLLKRTTLGYKVKAVGLNPFAADYAGISRKKYAFTSFVISGALAGVMGVLYYGAMNPSLSFASDTLPPIGFDSISVALVGQINPFGTVAAAFLWGVIKSGGPIGSVGLGIPNAVSDVIFGVIIYSAACAILLSKIAPIKSLISYFNIITNKERRTTFHHYLTNIWNNWMKTFQIKRKYRQKISTVKKADEDSQETKKAIAALVKDKKEEIQVCYSENHQEYQSLKNFFHKEYQKIWTTGLKGISNKAVKDKKHLYGENLNQYIKDRSAYEDTIHLLHQNYKSEVSLLKTQNVPLAQEKIKVINQEYQQQIKKETEQFNHKFSQLISHEQKKLAVIKERLNHEKSVYKKENKKAKTIGGK